MFFLRIIKSTKMATLLISMLALLWPGLLARAEVVPNGLFGDNAVLQQGRRVPVWGTASEGEKVSVAFGGQNFATVAIDGRWIVWLEPMKANTTPQVMTISGSNTLTYRNILVAPCKVIGPAIREAQLLSLKKTTNTSMTVITDWGETTANMHPIHKEPVGARLALAARALAYGQKLEYSGPNFKEAKPTGNSIVISFNHAGQGLLAKDGPLKGFTIAGPDKVFVAGTGGDQGRDCSGFLAPGAEPGGGPLRLGKRA